MRKTLFCLLMITVLSNFLFSDQWELISQGIEAVEQNDAQHALDLFSQAAGSRNTEIAAAGHYNYGTALAMAASTTEDPKEKRRILENAEAALRRSYTLAPDNRTQKNLYLVRRELLNLPEENEQEQNQQNQQENNDQSQEQKQQQEKGQNKNQQGNNGENQDQPQQQNNAEQRESEKTDSSSNPNDQSGKDTEQMQESKEAESEDQNENDQKNMQAGQESDEQLSEEEKEMQQILEKEARERAMRFLESAGGIQNVQKDW